MRPAIILAVCCTSVLVSPGGLGAQAIPRPDYFTYLLPGIPLPTTEQPATGAFHLYGDTASPGYADQKPRNGIDDSRDAWLTALSVRFAPWMVRNTVDYPMDWRRFVYEGPSFPLFVDVFDKTGEQPRLVRSQAIDLQDIERVPCRVSGAAAVRDTTPDCQLLALLERFAPDRRAAPRALAPSGAEQEVMYLDFPGEDPASWNLEYEGAVKGIISRRYVGWAKTYVHPFIAPVAGRPKNDPRYDVVLQYWFFYPINDAGNIHEGDWEHINIVLTTREQEARPFTQAELTTLLAGPASPEDFIIREVQYYFHHWVFELNYFLPNVYLAREEWDRQLDSIPPERFGEKAIWEQMRRQAYLDEEETRLNLHPIVFIGGDNRGLQQLISVPTRLGRASHGSYPFVGLYKDVGPGNTGELMTHRWDMFRTPPDSNAPETEPIVRLDNPDRIELIPDWERVLPMAFAEPEARARWAWLLLPMHFGYPATKSPFAGIVRYAETGNIAPASPSFNGGWNRPRAALGYARYQPHRLSSTFPASLQDNFRTGWGFFNLTVPTLVTLPGIDLIYRLVGAPFRKFDKSTGPAFFNSQSVPFRVFGVTGGVSSFQPSDDWLNLFAAGDLGLALLDSTITRAGTLDLGLRQGARQTDAASQWLAGANLYIGRRFVSESSVRHSRSTLGFDLLADAIPGAIPVQGTLNFWEYVGSLRYNLSVEGFQPYLKAGYGLSWYRLEDVTFDGHPLGGGAGDWVRQPSLFENLLPNTWHLGAGVEYVPIRSVGGVDLGVKADAAVHTHSLGVSANTEGFTFVQESRIYRWVFSLAGNVAF